MSLLRFAPSPTGLLHIGNARSAVLNWCLALAEKGRFLLRLDDTDRERSTPAYAAAIMADLAWLGIRPHLTIRQSDRLALYAAAAERLREAGLAYPCYETADELERRRKRQAARGLPPLYDRAALALGPADRARLEAEGRRPHWRFRLSGQTVAWQDGVRGLCQIETTSLSDPVLVREDGSPLYTFTSVVDDGELGVSLVLRGEDHVANTAVQIELFAALGFVRPAFAHHNLLTTAAGEGLSKRLGHLSLAGLREAGIEPLAVAALAALTGTSEAVRPVASLDELARLVSLDRISRAPARFDEAELAALSAKVLHASPYGAVAERLARLGIGGGPAFWEAVRGNCSKLADAAQWWRVVTGPLAGRIEPAERDYVEEALGHLPHEPWDGETWRVWTAVLKDRLGRKGKALFMPLRLALTGLDHGPDMSHLLPLIGRARAARRLSGGIG